jgi:hypothetical protein
MRLKTTSLTPGIRRMTGVPPPSRAAVVVTGRTSRKRVEPHEIES